MTKSRTPSTWVCPVCAKKLLTPAFSPNLAHGVFLQYYTEMKVHFLPWIVLMRKMLAKDNRGVQIKFVLKSHLKHQNQLYTPALEENLFSPLASHISVCSH